MEGKENLDFILDTKKFNTKFFPKEDIPLVV